VLFGRRGSFIFQAGRLLLAKRNAKALSEPIKTIMRGS
jgi:hypothetical protein